MMRLIKLFVVCLLALGIGTARAEFEQAAFEQQLLEQALREQQMKEQYNREHPSPKYSYDITAHSNCVLENSKNVQQTPIQSTRISTACRHKATPKKCRDVSAMPPDNESKSPQEICGEACAAAGMWSRKYGECSLD